MQRQKENGGQKPCLHSDDYGFTAKKGKEALHRGPRKLTREQNKFTNVCTGFRLLGSRCRGQLFLFVMPTRIVTLPKGLSLGKFTRPHQRLIIDAEWLGAANTS
jgi:hypothetical protein